MAYLILDDLRGPDGALTQLTTEEGTPNEAQDVLLQACIDDAQAITDGELGFTLTAAALGTQIAYGDGTAYLTPPPHTAGSVTEVTAPDGYTVPDYIQQNGILVTTDPNGFMYPRYPSSPTWWSWQASPFIASSGLWAAGVPYTVSATYGAAAADLLVVRRITLELAVQLYKFRDAGGSTVIGTEAAVINVKNTFSPLVKGAIERLKQKYAPSIGVW